MLDEFDKKVLLKTIYRLGYRGEGRFDGGALMCVGKLSDEWSMDQQDLDNIAGEIIWDSDEYS